jgi:UDP-glucose 4-epimerase
MKVLITGGAGFIGSHLAEYYVAAGHSVSVLDNFVSGSKRNLDALNGNVEIHHGDIRDAELVGSLVASADLVIHMAAALGVETILSSPIESISTNIFGSEIVLKAALEFNKRILIASTSEVYGKNPKQPLSESDDRVVGAPQKIRWTYSDSKAIEEATAHAMFKASGLRVTTVRFFNTVGPRQASNYGMVLPNFVKAALNNQDLRVYGDGNQTRVFCHVRDAVSAVGKLLNTENSIGEVFNVGGINEISMNSLAELVVARTNSSSAVVHVPYDEAYLEGYEDMQRRVPDITKIKSFCGWEPKFSIDQIIDSIAKEMKLSL